MYLRGRGEQNGYPHTVNDLTVDVQYVQYLHTLVNWVDTVQIINNFLFLSLLCFFRAF